MSNIIFFAIEKSLHKKKTANRNIELKYFTPPHIFFCVGGINLYIKKKKKSILLLFIIMVLYNKVLYRIFLYRISSKYFFIKKYLGV